MTRTLVGPLVAMFALLAPARASALISGGEGNKPVNDPGWPAGAEAIFNHSGRAAWWEGPPLGGGEWHAECRGDVAALNGVLAQFKALDVKTKRVVVHDGVGHSFWLAPNQEPDKLAAAAIDWVFVVWQPASWDRLQNLPADINPTKRKPAGADDTGPPAQIDVFTANLNWNDVKVPAGIEVLDQRLEAHGFTLADGVVVEGRVTDLATGKPLAATMQLQRIDPQQKGGYQYPVVAESQSDAAGRCVLKNVPAGWVRVVAVADGFVPRVVGHGRFDEQPQWRFYDAGLARAAVVAGRVTDEAGAPLADVAVRLDNVESSGGHYDSPLGFTFQTDAQGRFVADQVPAGKAKISLRKAGYCRPGLGLAITTPKADAELQMIKSGTIRAKVDFAGRARDPSYRVKLEPEGGDVIGSFGGSGTINEQNQITFENVPPGKYFLTARPNPSSDRDLTKPVAVDLKGGQTAEVTLKAK